MKCVGDPPFLAQYGTRLIGEAVAIYIMYRGGGGGEVQSRLPMPFPEVLEGEGLRSRVGGAVGSSAYERKPLVGLRPVLDGEGDCHL